MSEKRYTLELTAEELLPYAGKRPDSWLAEKLVKLAEQATADREAAELRLPWRAVDMVNEYGDRALKPAPDATWAVLVLGNAMYRTERQAKLMSAAPELLEAVKGAKRHLKDMDDYSQTGWLTTLIERALRKVETGTPEEP